MIWAPARFSQFGGRRYVGPGDIVSGATAWWGLRAYTSASIGSNAVRLREDGGNTEQDFATITGGGLPLSSISSFQGANNLFAVKLYDQVGTNHLVQATAANQPKFTLNVFGTLPALEFTSSGLFLANSGIGSISQPFSAALVLSPTTAPGAENEVFSLGNQIALDRAPGSTNFRVEDAAATPFDFPGLSVASHAVQCILNGASSSCYIDGTANAFSPNAGGISGVQTLGYLGLYSGTKFIGFVPEVGVWPFDFSVNASNLNNNQHGYWGF